MQPLRDTTFADVTDAEAVAACYLLLRQLRPHLSGPEELVMRWQSQARAGYRLITLLHRDRPTAVAGFRIQENLVHGQHLYVDDLVTEAAARGGGFGGALLQHLIWLARADGCAKLLLDTPLANVLGHRFYYRQGLVAGALRFNIAVDER
ncbi:GNAT family N-acetyltransferase [Methylobacterium sp. ARG-1]|uniref:GNAT family N-acetyltransferase n=1 Tax=Methylobacterium sp. ARG-1 TaxID=1692501 RepID=UPI000680E144|nr:GNAT family N-acetyltransferase [Methylobacterium sp. ARG-1]KNY21440.1 GCN5 family acetyltransferase [Methylobacterium sp. ARG-1]